MPAAPANGGGGAIAELANAGMPLGATPAAFAWALAFGVLAAFAWLSSLALLSTIAFLAALATPFALIAAIALLSALALPAANAEARLSVAGYGKATPDQMVRYRFGTDTPAA